MSIDDRQLVALAQKGDDEAFALLVARHQRYVYNLAYRLLQNPAEAEDLAQDAFVRAWRGLEHFRNDAKFTTWLYRIVTNLCYTRLANLRRELLDASYEDAEPLLPATGPDPAQQVERDELRQQVQLQVSELPAKYRLVVTLFYLQGFSYSEIAETLNLPMGTVKTHLFRARSLLKQRLKD